MPSLLVNNYSAPAQYEGMHRLADGGKDPATGQCKAISTAYKVEFTRALIVHSDNVQPASQQVSPFLRNPRASISPRTTQNLQELPKPPK
jgi:hypothetical protein